MCTLSLNCRAAAVFPAVALVAALAAGCSSGPATRVVDRLDQSTGTTIIVLAKPPEFVTAENRGPSGDPFAFAAPFVIDRMGNREQYLWVSVPQDNGTPSSVRVTCDGQPLELASVPLDLARLQLSKPPYPPVAPWSGDWYFRLPDASLGCLASARSMSIEATIDAKDGQRTDRFNSQEGDLHRFADFAAHLKGQ
ncbi:MAG TPA: hypothetical protein VEV18_04255 [Steroidobacteraceae bacterium]|nr:hypothetical protein [Steroidobacteraceae bacterium]